TMASAHQIQCPPQEGKLRLPDSPVYSSADSSLDFPSFQRSRSMSWSRSLWFGLGVWMLTFCAGVPAARADEKDGRLDIYFIDVEGGAATLFVTPAGESLLIDSGYPDNNGRDRDRILKVVREVAGLK